jgi:RNA polymerase sigma factor (sigma-70 family)
MTANTIRKFLDRFWQTTLRQEGKEQSDGQLLERFLRDRDRRALETLVQRHAPMVWGVCRRTLNHHDDAEDAFQATFLVLLRRADSVRPRERLANWLYGVAYKTARKARQKVAIRYSHEKQMETTPEAPTEAHEDGFEPELLARLDRALHALPQKYRTVVVLCALQGKSLRDAALQLRLPQGTVASRLARGRQMLAQRLTRPGVTVSATAVAAVLTEQAASAAVPDVLRTRTIQVVGQFAAGEGVTDGLLRAGASALAEGVLRSLTGAKKKTVVVWLLLATLVLGSGAAAYHSLTGQATRPVEPPEPAPQPPKVIGRGDEPVPGKYGTAAEARNVARTYLYDHATPAMFGISGINPYGHKGMFSPYWPSRNLDVTLDPKTHQWTVTGAVRQDIIGFVTAPFYRDHGYADEIIGHDKKRWGSVETEWKVVLSYDPTARNYGVQNAQGIFQGFPGGTSRPASKDEYGKWLQGKFAKLRPGDLAVTGLRLVVDVPKRSEFGLEPNYSYGKKSIAVESTPRGVQIHIDDQGAGNPVKRWTLAFGASFEHSLKVGEYGGAISESFLDLGPIMQVSHRPLDKDKRTLESWLGEFVVREIELQDKRVVRLAIDFIADSAYGLPSTAKRESRSIVRGSLRYNSQFESSIPGLDRDAAE